MFGDYTKILEQFSGVQEKIQEMQQKVSDLQATGESGGGAVRVTIKGDGIITNIDITPHMLHPDQKEICEDLIMAAHKHAKKTLDDLIARQQENLFGDMPIPPFLKNMLTK